MRVVKRSTGLLINRYVTLRYTYGLLSRTRTQQVTLVQVLVMGLRLSVTRRWWIYHVAKVQNR